MDISNPPVRSSRTKRSAAKRAARTKHRYPGDEIREFESYHYFVVYNHEVKIHVDCRVPLDVVVNEIMASILRPEPKGYDHYDLAVADVAVLVDRRVLAVIHQGPDGRPVATFIGAANRNS